MFIVYFRSSFLGSYEWCEHQSYLTYVLGLKNPAGEAAQVGSIVHKALELVARYKKACQDGLDRFTDPELSQYLFKGAGEDIEERMDKNSGVYRDYLMDRGLENSIGYNTKDYLDIAYKHYTDPSRSVVKWAKRHHTECQRLLDIVLNYDGGEYSPANREVVQPEQYFDLTIEQKWAKYIYPTPDGGQIQGNLAIKGTLDLITRLDSNTIEYVDWKTGRRHNYKEDREKTLDDMKSDPQFLLYFYALSRLYPGQTILFTVFYVRSGGPFTIPFGKADIGRAEGMLKDYFETMRRNKRPALVQPHNWKCVNFCNFYKNKWEGTDKSVCHHFRDEIIQLGLDRVTHKYADFKTLANYGDGGGVSRS